MAKEWFTASELAGLPEMPSTERGVREWVARNSVTQRKRSKGKGREYWFGDLPERTQVAALKRHQPEPPPSRPESEGVADRDSLWEAFERKPQKQKDEAARRLAALQAVERLIANGSGRSRAVEAVAKEYGESRATVYRWQKAVKKVDRSDWLAKLAPGYQGRTARAECDPEAWEFFKWCYLRPEAPAVATCYEWTKQRAQNKGWQLPCKRTLSRWIEEIPRTQRVLMRQGEYAMMQLYPAQERSVRELHALQWINGDGYTHNVFVRFEDGTVDRPVTWFWQDVHSRKMLAWRTDQTENSDTIRLALGDVLEHYGIPEHATIDNTRAAANKWLTGGAPHRYRFKVREEDPLGLMPQLGIQVHWTTVHKGKGHGQAKPTERAFGKGGFGEYVDKHPALKGAYTGRSVEEKPENYGERAVDFETFRAVLAEAITHWNAKEGRESEICGGKLSYDAAFKASYERNAHLIRRATEAQRRLWLLAAESVKVKRDGSVALTVGAGPNGKNRYGCDALIEYAGRQVVVRFDPDHLHETAYIYQLDGRYIGEAECIHAVGFGDTQAGRDWNRAKKQKLKAEKQAAQAQVRMSDTEAMDSIPAPEPDEPEETNVVRGAWADHPKQAAGAETQAGEEVSASTEESAGEKYSFNELMEEKFQKFKEENG